MADWSGHTMEEGNAGARLPVKEEPEGEGGGGGGGGGENFLANCCGSMRICCHHLRRMHATTTRQWPTATLIVRIQHFAVIVKRGERERKPQLSPSLCCGMYNDIPLHSKIPHTAAASSADLATSTKRIRTKRRSARSDGCSRCGKLHVSRRKRRREKKRRLGVQEEKEERRNGHGGSLGVHTDQARCQTS